MQFDWDADNTDHIARHNVRPVEAEEVIELNPLDADTVFRNGETRTIIFGPTSAGRMLAVIVTERGNRLRVVTARDANRKEREFYATHKVKTHDEDT
jgi:uncharacterized DUF497 family protein